MNSQLAILPSLLLPPGTEVIDSAADRTSTAFRKFDERSANSTHIDLPSRPVPALEHWIQPAPQTYSLGRKGVAITIVALVHVIAAFILAQMAPQIHEAPATPLQVVMIAAPLAVEDAPPPPLPNQQLPALPVAIEPVINIAVPESNSITVAVSPTESTPAPNSQTTDAPKLVSSVEYVREPVARYPSAARALKQRGTVTLRALIDPTGHAREVNVHRSSGHRLLDDTARQAVLNALFKPYTENGHSIPVYVLIPIEFGATG